MEKNKKVVRFVSMWVCEYMGKSNGLPRTHSYTHTLGRDRDA